MMWTGRVIPDTDIEEGEAMKRYWLRGILLGVSIALLLAGGVALAQGLTIRPDRDCFTCSKSKVMVEAAELEPENIVKFAIGGRSGAGDYLHFNFYRDGEFKDCWQHPNEDDNYYMWAYCDQIVVFWDHVEDWADASTSDIWLDFGYGEWTVEVCPGMCEENSRANQAPECGEATVLLAEVCEVEFVPEPGSMLLLGSGLAGLAGYAALRWRTRE
jgi:hypothetical protein